MSARAVPPVTGWLEELVLVGPPLEQVRRYALDGLRLVVSQLVAAHPDATDDELDLVRRAFLSGVVRAVRLTLLEPDLDLDAAAWRIVGRAGDVARAELARTRPAEELRALAEPLPVEDAKLADRVEALGGAGVALARGVRAGLAGAALSGDPMARPRALLHVAGLAGSHPAAELLTRAAAECEQPGVA